VRRATICAVAAVAAAGAAGAGAGAVATAGGHAGATTLRLKADAGGALRFTKTRLSAEPGRITIRMKNPGGSGKPHAIAIRGNGVSKRGATAQPGGRSTVSARLSAGRYTFYCPVPGHEAMKGRLTVG
jgi:plastocyanin